MSGFYYFLPVDAATLIVDGCLDVKQLAAHKLHDVLGDATAVPATCIATPITAGPDGKAGVVLFPISPGVEHPKVPGYLPDSQTWHAAGGHWIGYEKDKPPRPEDIARTTQVPGYFVPDNHGRSWCVPLIRGLDRPYGALPCDYEFGEDFLPVEVLRTRYRSLWRDSAAVWTAYDESNGGIADAFAAQFAARCLAINYRMGPHEFNLLAKIGLNIFDRVDVMKISGTAVDAPAVLKYIEEKKTIPCLPVPSGTTSSHGITDETTTGDQPAASCD